MKVGHAISRVDVDQSEDSNQVDAKTTPLPLFELFEFVPRLNRLLDASLKNLDPPMTFGQYRTLRRVAEGFNTLTAIANVGTLSVPALSERIDGMVRKGLVRRRTNRRDRRSATLSLTPDGRRVLDEGQKVLESLSDSLMAGMSEDDVAQVIDSAHKVAQSVTAALSSRATPPRDG